MYPEGGTTTVDECPNCKVLEKTITDPPEVTFTMDEATDERLEKMRGIFYTGSNKEKSN